MARRSRRPLALAAAAALLAAPAALFAAPAAQAYAGDCSSGFTCVYGAHDGDDMVIALKGCGFFNLGQYGANDEASSIVNNSGHLVQAYDWKDRWVPVGDAFGSGWLMNYWGGQDHVIDGVNVSC